MMPAAEISDLVFIIILLGSFIAAILNAAFATGGAFLMLAISASVLPINTIVPLQSTFLFGSLVSRCIYFWSSMVWKIVIPFSLGCIIGAFLGARIYLDLPDALIALAIGLLMLGSTWFPKINWNVPLKHPYFVVGILHSFLSTLFAFGAFLHTIIIRTQLNKPQITATLAGSLLMMGVFKIVGYIAFGFDYLPYLWLILGATLAGFAGTWVGKRVSITMSEQKFRLIFKCLITLFAFRLLYRAWTLY